MGCGVCVTHNYLLSQKHGLIMQKRRHNILLPSPLSMYHVSDCTVLGRVIFKIAVRVAGLRFIKIFNEFSLRIRTEFQQFVSAVFSYASM